MTANPFRVLLRAAIGTLLAAASLVMTGSPASAATSVNLIKNFGAEAPPGGGTGVDIDVPHWDDRTGATVARYGAQRFFPNSSTPGPTSRGNSFFYGGPNPDSIFVQTPDLTKFITKIKTGVVKVNVVAWLGGIGSENDRCDFRLVLADSEDDTIKEVRLNGPTAAERGNTTKFVKRTATVAVPALTRLAGAHLICDNALGAGANTGIADNLVVKLQNV